MRSWNCATLSSQVTVNPSHRAEAERKGWHILRQSANSLRRKIDRVLETSKGKTKTVDNLATVERVNKDMKYLSGGGHRESYSLVARKRYMKKLLYVYIHYHLIHFVYFVLFTFILLIRFDFVIILIINLVVISFVVVDCWFHRFDWTFTFDFTDE